MQRIAQAIIALHRHGEQTVNEISDNIPDPDAKAYTLNGSIERAQSLGYVTQTNDKQRNRTFDLTDKGRQLANHFTHNNPRQETELLTLYLKSKTLKHYYDKDFTEL